MPRYDIVDLSRTIYLAKEEFKKDIKKYEEYLKVSGNNYKYPYIHQISIYNMDPKATACAEFDYWKSIGRSVKRGEKGIPLLDIDSGRIKYIFDIRQTVSINHNISEVKLWKYDSKKHLNLLDELIDKFKEKDSKLLLSQEDKIDALVESNVRGKFNKILESLSDESLKSIQKVDLFNLLKESVKISISERMEVSYQLKEENLSLLSKISSSDIDKVLSISANISKNILLDLGSEIKRLEILEKIQERKDLEQTKELKERYNKLSSDINGEINFKGGLEDERESNIGRQGIPHGGGDLHTNRQGEFLRETGRDIQDGRIGGRHGSPNTQYGNSQGNRFKETQQMGKDEIELSQGEQRRGLSDNVFARDIDGSSSIKGKRDRGLYHEGRSQNDGNLGSDRRTERRGLSEISEIEEEHGYDPTRNRGKGDNPNLKNEEVESTSFFSAKNHGEQISFSNPISQREIDTFLIHGGNHEDGRLAVIAEFSKGKSLEEQANFLKEIYRGANGLEIEGRKISAWFGKEGAIFKDGDEARYREGQIVSWKDLANNINNLLDRGEFASNVEVIESATYEREKIAETLLYLKRDLSDETKDRYLASLNDIKGRGFQDEKENLGKKLEDKNFINKLRKEYEVFLEEYKINPDILRFHHYKLSRIYNDINDLEIERKLYRSNLKDIAPIQSFITQDEIDESLKRGSGFSDGKKRIYEFFTEKHDLKEQADFLKNEYGVGGSSHALSAARESGEWHDAKGIKYNKGNAKEILLSWSNVARRINDLIKKNRYIDEESFEENREKKTDQEINKTEKESQEYINYQDDLPPTDNMVMRGEGLMKRAMSIMGLGAFINIVLDPILMKAMGDYAIEGAAIATVTAQIIQAVITLYYFKNKSENVKIGKIKKEKDISKEMFGVGVSAMIMQVFFMVQQTLLYRQAFRYGGDPNAILMSATLRFYGFSFIPIWGMSQGLQPIIGTNFGAKQYDRVKETMKIFSIGGTVLAAIFWLPAQVFSKQLLGLFKVSQDIISSGVNNFRIFYSVFILYGIMIMTITFFQAIGDGKKAGMIVMLRQLILLVPALLIFPRVFGAGAVWWAEPVVDFTMIMVGLAMQAKAISTMNLNN